MKHSGKIGPGPQIELGFKSMRGMNLNVISYSIGHSQTRCKFGCYAVRLRFEKDEECHPVVEQMMHIKATQILGNALLYGVKIQVASSC
jgi:hypothetical protein